MDLRIFTEPQQGATYGQLLAVAKATEAAGFSGFFRSDHYLKMGDVSGLPGPTHAWVTLAGLARETGTVRLGTLVSPATFYRPGPLAIAVAQVDEMSGGRVELGFGTGWYEAEHPATGLDFPSLSERFDRMEEYLEQITGFWATPEGETFDHQGRFHTFADSPALPKPTQRPGPPLIIGGRGTKRTPALVARFASEYNVPFSSIDDLSAAYDRVRAACDTAGRDPSELTYSAALVLCLGADESEVTRRAAAIGREPDELRRNGAAGTPDEVAAKLAAYAEAGCQRMYLQVLDVDDLDHVSAAGETLLAAAAAL
jgi:F420-dependent oxidoreductase-like protein